MATTAKNNSYGGHMTEAATLAQDKLEEFRANQWQQILPTTGGPQTDQKPGSAGIDYTRNWSVAINPLNPNLKEITITVNWNDRVGHSIRLLSVLSQ